MKNSERFSIRARSRSFRYAFEGLINFFKTEHNTWIHLLGTVIVVCLAIWCHVSGLEAIALVLAVGFVWVAELLIRSLKR